jgi:hypothetical protein
MAWLDLWSPELSSSTFVGWDSVYPLVGLNKQPYLVRHGHTPQLHMPHEVRRYKKNARAAVAGHGMQLISYLHNSLVPLPALPLLRLTQRVLLVLGLPGQQVFKVRQHNCPCPPETYNLWPKA